MPKKTVNDTIKIIITATATSIKKTSNDKNTEINLNITKGNETKKPKLTEFRINGTGRYFFIFQ